MPGRSSRRFVGPERRPQLNPELVRTSGHVSRVKGSARWRCPDRRPGSRPPQGPPQARPRPWRARLTGERGEYLDGSAVRRRCKQALTAVKLRRLRLHDLRHTFGSIAIDQARIVQVQAWMGHADVQTTLKYMRHRSRAGDARLLSAALRP